MLQNSTVGLPNLLLPSLFQQEEGYRNYHNKVQATSFLWCIRDTPWAKDHSMHGSLVHKSSAQPMCQSLKKFQDKFVHFNSFSLRDGFWTADIPPLFFFFASSSLCTTFSTLFLLFISLACWWGQLLLPPHLWDMGFLLVWWWIEKPGQTYCHQWCHCTSEMHAVVIYWEAEHTYPWQTVLDHLYHLWWAALALLHWLCAQARPVKRKMRVKFVEGK